MSVYKKLMEARVELHSMDLKKSGFNKFSSYAYFELGDFLPQTLRIFNRIGLCGTVSFSQELATLRIVDVDKPEQAIEFASPMGSANLKGCHEVQNVGAVQTYQRRYLWATAMEIVEHDPLDSTVGMPKNTRAAPPAPAAAAKPAAPKPAKAAAMTEEELDNVVDSIGIEDDLDILIELYVRGVNDARSQPEYKKVIEQSYQARLVKLNYSQAQIKDAQDRYKARRAASQADLQAA